MGQTGQTGAVGLQTGRPTARKRCLSIFKMFFMQDIFEANCPPINREFSDTCFAQAVMVKALASRREKGL